MQDPDKSRRGDFQERRASGFEPVDTRIWELPDKEEPPPQSARRQLSANWLMLALVILMVVVAVLVVLWIL